MQSVPTAGNVTSRRNLFSPLLLVITGGNFGREQKGHTGTPPIQDLHALRASCGGAGQGRAAWRGAETVVLGTGIPTLLITDCVTWDKKTTFL